MKIFLGSEFENVHPITVQVTQEDLDKSFPLACEDENFIVYSLERVFAEKGLRANSVQVFENDGIYFLYLTDEQGRDDGAEFEISQDLQQKLRDLDAGKTLEPFIYEIDLGSYITLL